MSNLQIAFVAALGLVFVIRGPCYGMWVVTANMVATLAVCLMMDFDALTRENSTIYMMLIDLISGVALVVRPGINRVASMAYAITVPIYSANVIFGVPIDATFAVIYLVLFAQLGVFGIGRGGGNGVRNRHRLPYSFRATPPSPRIAPVAKGPVSLVSGSDRVAE